MLPMFGNMSPKELRAMAKQLNAMAQALEMSQDPQKFMEKKMKSQVNGVKRKMKNQMLKGIGL
jgi:hypothetical protein